MLEGAHAGQAIVYVVDDEPSIRNSTKELAESGTRTHLAKKKRRTVSRAPAITVRRGLRIIAA